MNGAVIRILYCFPTKLLFLTQSPKCCNCEATGRGICSRTGLSILGLGSFTVIQQTLLRQVRIRQY